jgi:hypothetical protein
MAESFPSKPEGAPLEDSAVRQGTASAVPKSAKKPGVLTPEGSGDNELITK